jgi:hypothetical protein
VKLVPTPIDILVLFGPMIRDTLLYDTPSMGDAFSVGAFVDFVCLVESLQSTEQSNSCRATRRLHLLRETCTLQLP